MSISCPDCASLKQNLQAKDAVIRTMSRARSQANESAEKWQAVAYRLADELAQNTEHNQAYWLDTALEMTREE